MQSSFTVPVCTQCHVLGSPTLAHCPMTGPPYGWLALDIEGKGVALRLGVGASKPVADRHLIPCP